jgi:hypothetical protein
MHEGRASAPAAWLARGVPHRALIGGVRHGGALRTPPAATRMVQTFHGKERFSSASADRAGRHSDRDFISISISTCTCITPRH